MKNLYIAIPLLFSLLFISCEDLLVKELELEEFDFESQLVISGVIDNNTEEIAIYVAENSAITSNYSNPEESAVSDATVNVYKGSTLIGSPEYNPDQNIYFLSIAGSELTEGDYALEVSAGSFPDVRATTSIPNLVPLKEIEYIEDAGIHPNTLERSDAIIITFDDPDGKNFYGFNIISSQLGVIMDTFIYNMDTTIFEYSPFIDIASNDPDVFLNDAGFLMPDDFFEGREKSITLFIDAYDIDIAEIKEVLVISWENLSEEKYLFSRSLELYQNSGDFGPFSEAVSVYTNVENGLGYFAGSHRSFYSLP